MKGGKKLTHKDRLKLHKASEKVRGLERAKEKALAAKKTAAQEKLDHLRVTGKKTQTKTQLEAARALKRGCEELNRLAKKPPKMPRLRGLQQFINYLKSRQFIPDDGKCGCEGTGRLLPDRYTPLRAA